MTEKRYAGVIVAAALVSRLFVLWPILQNPSQAYAPDSMEYVLLAKNLLSHAAFSTDTQPPFRPETFRTPGYSIFLAAFLIFSNSPLPIALSHILISVLAIFLAWRWYLQIGGLVPAFCGAMVLAIDPVTVLHTPLILSDTLFFSLLIPAGVLTWNAMSSESAKKSAVAGIFWGVSTMLRQVSLYVPLLLAWIPGSRKAKAGFLMAAYLLPGLWVVRNITRADLAAVSSMGRIHLLRCFAGGAQALSLGRADLSSDLEAEILAAHPNGFSSDVEQSRIYAAKAMPIIKAHPWRVLQYCFWGTVKTLGGTGLDMMVDLVRPGHSHELTGTSGTPKAAGLKTLALMKYYPVLFPIFGLYVLALGSLYLAHLAGVWILAHKKLWAQAAFLFIVPVYFLLVTNHAGYYRQRIPMMPFLAAGLVVTLKGIGLGKGNGREASA